MPRCIHEKGLYCSKGADLKTAMREAFDAKAAHDGSHPSSSEELDAAYSAARLAFNEHIMYCGGKNPPQPKDTPMTHATEEELIVSDSAGTSIPTHPEDQYAATCIDIIDYGMVEMTWQGKTKSKHRIAIRFFCGEYGEDSEGKKIPLWVDSWFTFTLDERGKLRPFLEAWRGPKFTPEELKGFNLIKLLHAPALVQVAHEKKGDKTYANITSIQRLPKAMTAPGVPNGYVRVKDRPKDDDSEQPNGGFGAHDDDDSLPF